VREGEWEIVQKTLWSSVGGNFGEGGCGVLPSWQKHTSRTGGWIKKAAFAFYVLLPNLLLHFCTFFKSMTTLTAFYIKPFFTFLSFMSTSIVLHMLVHLFFLKSVTFLHPFYLSSSILINLAFGEISSWKDYEANLRYIPPI
jgi:hypothetical protein